MSDSLHQRVRSSVKLTMGATVATALIQATTMIVLARVLGPIDYGFFVVALSIAALSTAFVGSGIERAMVLEADATVLMGRALPVTLLLCVVAMLACLAAAAVKALTEWKVDLEVLTIVLAGQVVGGPAVATRAILRREIRFAPIIASELVGLLLGNLLTAAILGLLGFGAFALAWASLVQSIVVTVWMMYVAKPGSLRPRFGGLGSLPDTVLGLMKPTTLEAVNGQVSPIVVSSILGPVSLGFFNRIFNITTLPIQLLMSSVNRVIISTLVAVADDAERRQRAAELMIRAGSAMITPVALGLAGSAANFTMVALGPKWTGATPIVPFLAVAVWANMLASLLSQLVDAVRRFNEKARIQAYSTASLVMLLLVGGHWGLIGVAVGAMFGAMLFLALYLKLASDILEITVGALLRWLIPGLVAGGGCFIATLETGRAFAQISPLMILGLQVILCGVISLTVLVFFDRATALSYSKLLLPRRVDRVFQSVLARI